MLSSKVHLNGIVILQVSALVTMYSHEEDIDGAIDVFKQAIEHYQSEQVCVDHSQLVLMFSCLIYCK